MHENPADHVRFIEERLGGRRYKSLQVQAETPKKIDREGTRLWLKAMLKGMEEKEEVFGRH